MPEFIKLRTLLYHSVSVIWINPVQTKVMLRIYNNVRQSIVAQYDFASFNRYMADVIGLLQPITNANVYKTLAELILKDA